MLITAILLALLGSEIGYGLWRKARHARYRVRMKNTRPRRKKAA